MVLFANDGLPQYAICKTKVSLDRDKIPQALDALQSAFADAKPDRRDGLRLDWPQSWLLVRGSQTEPLVRVIAEAKTPDRAQEMCDRANEVIGCG